MQVRAFDADGTSANNQISYQLGDPSDPFSIDSVTGNITTLKMFDREEKSFYNIKIIATDNSESALIPGKHNSGQQSFLIEIADKNDNPPHFTMDTYVAESIAENANINELVTQVTALDIDTGKLKKNSSLIFLTSSIAWILSKFFLFLSGLIWYKKRNSNIYIVCKFKYMAHNLCYSFVSSFT